MSSDRDDLGVTPVAGGFVPSAGRSTARAACALRRFGCNDGVDAPTRAVGVRGRSLPWLAFAAAAAFQLISLAAGHGWSVERMTRPASAVTGPGFDGQFFAALANDPLVGEATVARLDAPLLRATRIGYPLAAGLSGVALGETARGLVAAQALSLAIVLAGLSWGRVGTAEAPVVLAVAFCLPFALSLELLTAELPTAAAVVVASAAAQARRLALTCGALAFACLAKEVALLAVVAFALVSLWERRFVAAALVLAAAAPLVAWHTWLVLRFGPWPSGGGLRANLMFPGWGVAQALGMHLGAVASGSGRAAALLAALVWHLAGVALAVRLTVGERPTPGRLVACAGALLAITLSAGAPAHAYDEVFNFGRQLFLLPVGLLLVRFHEGETLRPPMGRALTAWLVAGGLLGGGWWLVQVATALPR